MKIIERIFDANTGITQDIERDLTAQEREALELEQKELKERAKIISENNAKRLALLEKLGITEEEAKLLLS